MMLNGIATFFIRKKIGYKSVKFRYHSPLRDIKSVRYIHEFVISEFVITENFCKDFFKNFTGDSKRYIRVFAISVFELNEFYCKHIRICRHVFKELLNN